MPARFLFLVIVLAGGLFPAPALSQGATDIFLVRVHYDGPDPGRLGDPIRVTDRDGYDNQPQFTADGSGLLFTSARADGQTDIYRYDRESQHTFRVTQTPESEYSPTPIPGSSHFSVVRVEADSTQRLWRFDSHGLNPQLVIATIQPVGYHAWLHADQLALFVLGDPPTLQIVDPRSPRPDTVATRIGRSVHRIPNTQQVSYVDKSQEPWRIMALAPDAPTPFRIAHARPGGEDYAWTPSGHLLMAEDSRIFAASGDGSWQEIADWAARGIGGITRLAVSPDGQWLALVATR